MKAGIECTKNGIKDRLAGMATRANAVSTFLQRVIYPAYLKAQERRWESENSSEGETWAPVQPAYAKTKLTKFASYPGGGTKTMVATGRTSFAATGRNPNDAYKLITNTQFVVGINQDSIPYAQYAAERRPIMRFSDDTVNDWKNQLAVWVNSGVERGA